MVTVQIVKKKELRMKNSNKIRIVPLGGMREIGKNLTVIEYRDDIILVVCLMYFPGDVINLIDKELIL